MFWEVVNEDRTNYYVIKNVLILKYFFIKEKC